MDLMKITLFSLTLKFILERITTTKITEIMHGTRKIARTSFRVGTHLCPLTVHELSIDATRLLKPPK